MEYHILYITLRKFKYFMSYDKVLLLTRRHYQNRTRNCGQRHFRKFWTSYIQNFDQKMTF